MHAESMRGGIAARLLVVLLLLSCVAAGLWGWGIWQDYRRFADAPLLDSPGQQLFEFRRGSSFAGLVDRVRELGHRDAPVWYWKLLALETGADTSLKAGEYAIDQDSTPRSLLDDIRAGRVVQHRFTIIEGWNFRELRAAIAVHPALEQTLSGVDDQELMNRIGQPNRHPEGQFLPETYLFPRGFSDEDLLRRAHLALVQAKEQAWTQRDPDLPIDDPYQMLILASIIEKETGLASERERVAGVFVRRLQLGMRLQTDPTVVYGLGDDYGGRLTRINLRTDTPYNTYTRHGLPPTPIALAGKESLLAAVRPAPGKELYFVSRGDGSHQFSETYEQHRRAVRRYILGQG